MTMENNTPQFQPEESIDIRKYLLKFLANWYWFICSLILCGSLAYMSNKFAEPVYSVSATVIVKDDNKSMGGGNALFGNLDLFSNQKNLYNEIGVIKSYTLTRNTLNDLDFGITYVSVGKLRDTHLYTNAPFHVTIGEGFEAYIGIPLYVTILSETTYNLVVNDGFDINISGDFDKPYNYKGFYFNITMQENYIQQDFTNIETTNDYYFIINDLDQLAYSYNAKLEVELADNEGSILNLGITGFVPQKEVDFLNTLIDNYLQSGLDEKNRIASNTVNFIDEQLQKISDTLKQAEMDLESFRKKQGVIDISLEGQAIIDQLEKIQTEKTLIDMKATYYNYLLEYLDKDIDLKEVMAPSVMGINDPMLTTLIENLATLVSRKAQMEISARENNPALQLINVDIKSTRESLTETVKNIIEGTKLNQKDVDSRIRRINSEIQKLPITEREMIGFERKYTLSNEVYVYLQQKRAEAGIVQASNVSDNLPLDPARIDNAEKVSPKTMFNYVIAILIGLSIPILLIILKDSFNTKIIERSEIENFTKIPIIGTVGHYSKDGSIPVTKYPRASISESFRAIRTNLQFSLFEKDQKIITLTSTIGKEGKSFCALNLSAVFAASNKKTLLVGLDLRKPVLHKELKLANTQGISTYLIGKNKYEEIIIPTAVKNLSVAVAGPVPPNPAELFETEAFTKFMERTKKEFDYIIIDTPPMALVTDAILISKYSDLMLFVIRQNYSQKNALKFIEEINSRNQIKKLQILINDVKIPKYYGYKYGYGYGYGYYTGKSYGHGYYVED